MLVRQPTSTTLIFVGAALSLAAARSLPAQCGLQFGPTQAYPAGSSPQALAVGDLNGDPFPDLAVGSSFGGSGLRVMFGTPGGGFDPPIGFGGGPGMMRSVCIADFNGDNLPDITGIGGGGGGAGSMLLRQPGGGFVQSIAYAVGGNSFSIAAAQLTGGAELDIAAAVQTTNSVAILQGNGDGTFQPMVTYMVGVAPSALALGHLNADGLLDIVVANESSGDLSVLLGAPGGAFTAGPTTPIGAGGRSLALADLNGDGRPDVVVVTSGSQLLVLLGTGGGNFQSPVAYGGVAGPQGVAVGDIDVDGRLDAVAVGTLGTASVFLGNGDGTLQSAVPVSMMGSGVAVLATDLDGIPGLDLVDALTTGSVAVALNQAPPLQITQHPDPCQVVSVGQQVVLTATATGPGNLSYQWRKNGSPLSNGGVISGAQTATLTISSAGTGDSGAYSLRVTSTCGNQIATSNDAVLAVTGGADPCAGQQPTISQHPVDRDVLTGNFTIFSVTAGPPGVTYRWRRGGVNLSNGGVISGATSPTLTVSNISLADDGSAFDCVVTNSCGSTRSNPAGLGVSPRCPADFDNNGAIQSADIATFVTEWLAQLSAGC